MYFALINSLRSSLVKQQLSSKTEKQFNCTNALTEGQRFSKLKIIQAYGNRDEFQGTKTEQDVKAIYMLLEAVGFSL